MERKSIEIARKNNIWAKWKKKILSENCGSRRDAENNGQNKDRVWESEGMRTRTNKQKT